jgi:GNAT superfamily N-acetyltransferase
MDAGPEVWFEKALPEDAMTLASVCRLAFDNDVHYGAPGRGGPPGYDSDLWQTRMMLAGIYYKILHGDQIIGGFIVQLRGYQYYELVRIFIHPYYQNQGIGTQAFEFIWQEFPDVKRWTLGTPAWNQRTRHFYGKVGFIEIGEDGRGGILLERKIAAADSA